MRHPKSINPKHNQTPWAEQCPRTVTGRLTTGNPKNDPNWMKPRIAPIVGKRKNHKLSVEGNVDDTENPS
jgi:hypothetical protein